MPGLLGKKIGMTSVFSADGKNVPCTVIEARSLCSNSDQDCRKGWICRQYQLGFQEAKEKNTTASYDGTL